MSRQQRSGLERRITKLDMFLAGRGAERRVQVLDECGELIAGFADRRGPDHFAEVPRKVWLPK